MNDLEKPKTLAITARVVAVHAAIGVFFFLFLLVIVPRYKHEFADASVRVPWMVTLTINASDFLIASPSPLLVALMLLLGVDALVFALLFRKEETRILSWLWALLIAMVMAAVPASAWFAVQSVAQEIPAGIEGG